MIAIVDYGLGNLKSIYNMLKHIGFESTLTSDASEIAEAERLILPGVGSFDAGMKNLSELGLVDVLNEQVLEQNKPVLGICLGIQLMARRSEEGELPGLGWIEADVIRFAFGPNQSGLRVPHMGWNTVTPRRHTSLFREILEETRYYFVHSYHLACDDERNVLATCEYGFEFPCAVEKGNVLGTQFHPEKSHRYGMQLLRCFAESA